MYYYVIMFEREEFMFMVSQKYSRGIFASVHTVKCECC